MAETTVRTRDEFVALADAATETAIATCLDTTFTGGIRKVTRAQVLKALVRRALRKSTQGAMRAA